MELSGFSKRGSLSSGMRVISSNGSKSSRIGISGSEALELYTKYAVAFGLRLSGTVSNKVWVKC